jgi:hypothetical protein
MRMAESGTTDFAASQGKLVDAEIETAKRGQWFAIGITVVSIGLTAGFVAAHIYAGAVFLATPVVLLVRAFLDRDKG